MSNKLSNFLSHIKNSQNNKILITIINQSKIIISILNILQELGYIRGYRLININYIPKIEILLKYKNQIPVIKNIIIISKPSKRIYISIDELYNKYMSTDTSVDKIYILSTSKGIMTHLKAYNLNIGGEIICCIN